MSEGVMVIVRTSQSVFRAKAWGAFAVAEGQWGEVREGAPPKFSVYALEPTEGDTPARIHGQLREERTRWAAECFARDANARFPELVVDPRVALDPDLLTAVKAHIADYVAPPEPFSHKRSSELRRAWQEASHNHTRRLLDLEHAKDMAEAAREDVEAWEALCEAMTREGAREREESSDRDDTLEAFGMEPDHGPETLERYQREHPRFADDLAHYAAAVRAAPPTFDTALDTLTGEEKRLVDAAYAAHVAESKTGGGPPRGDHE